MAEALLAAAAETLQLWAGGELDYPDLAEDIAIAARLAPHLTEEIKDPDERTALLLAQADPKAILTSAPGVAHITAAAILGRLGDPERFTSLAGVRAFTGLVPTLDASGLTGRHGPPTKRGDAVLRQALFMAAGQARRIDPNLAAKYHRLMVGAGKHHNSALCHIATALLSRIVACWRTGQPCGMTLAQAIKATRIGAGRCHVDRPNWTPFLTRRLQGPMELGQRALSGHLRPAVNPDAARHPRPVPGHATFKRT